MNNSVRPTKKQRQLLSFIGNFIAEHGYSPSYREIMTGLDYTSVATVAVHVNNLIRRGHLRKRDHSARSIEIVNSGAEPALAYTGDWLTGQVKQRLIAPEPDLEKIKVLVAAMVILEHPQAGQMEQQLKQLVAKTTTSSAGET